MPDPSPHSAESGSINELKARNRALTEQIEKLALAATRPSQNDSSTLDKDEVLDVMLWSVDHDLSFTSINELAQMRICAVFGITPKVGDKLSEVLKFLDPVTSDFWSGLYSKALGGEGVSFLYELDPPSTIGQRFHCTFNSFDPIKVDGKVVGVSCLAQDITQSMNTVRVLDASEKRFRALAEQGNDVLTIRNVHSDVIYDSPSKYRMLGYEDNEESMPSGHDMVHPDDRALLDAAYKDALSSPGKRINQQCRVLREDGTIRHVQGYVTNMLDVPEVAGVVCSMRDITELVEATEQVKISAALMAQAERIANFGSWEMELQASGTRSSDRQRWSDQKYRILGMEPGTTDPTIGNFLNAVHPDDLPEVQRVMLEAIRHEKPCSLELRILRPDGTTRWVLQEAYVIDDALVQGKKRIIGTLQDITSHKEAEKGLRHSEERFRALIEGSAEGIILTDDHATILYASPAITPMLGYTPQEMVGRSSDGLLVPGEREKMDAAVRRVLTQPGATERITYRVTHKNGQKRWMFALVTNMLHIPAVSAIVTNYRDITERVELHEEMVFDHNNLSALINSTNDPVWSVDADYRLITANEAYISNLEKIIGYRIAPGESLMIKDLEGIPMTADFHAHFLEAMKGLSLKVEEHITNPVEAWLEFHYNPILQNGVVAGVACFTRNITAKRIAQRAAEKALATALASEQEKSTILDALSANIALLDGDGSIVAVNAAWRDFAKANGYQGDDLGVGRNYIQVSRSTAGPEAEMGNEAAAGLEEVLSGRSKIFSMEYPCHSREQRRWFRLQVTALSDTDHSGAVVMHVDITDRVLAEEEVLRSNSLLEERVMERTKELQQANSDLDAEIVKNKQLSDVVNARNRELMSSIAYASYIQLALMPAKERFAFFQDKALLSRPRDVLSGDFLWCHETNDHIIVAVADCTGHGVPGAMMSMLGHESLNSIVQDSNLIQPERILSKLDLTIERLFQQSGDFHVTDGMDIAMVIVEKATLASSFCGAMLQALIIRDGEPILLPASKATIGGHLNLYNKEFKRYDHQLRKGDRIVLFTDGFADQFGGPRNKKFFRKNLVKHLLSTASLSATEAKDSLGKKFDEWKGHHEQVDDVTVLLLDV